MLRLIQSVAVTCAIIFSTTGKAQTPEPTFPLTIRLPSTEAVLVKIGEHRYFHNMIFKLYDIALYTKNNAKIDEVLKAKTIYRLEFRYLRKIDKSIILKSSVKMLAKNLTPDEHDIIKTRLNGLSNAYQTVEKGDYSSLTYQPDIGTTLNINGSHIITIEGEDFARLYFAIWLGESPISKNLRRDLIGTLD